MQVLSPREAVERIPDGARVVVAGNGSLLAPEALLQALESRFLETGHPRELSVFYPVVVGTREGTGIDHLAHRGLVREVIASCFDIWGIRRLAEMVRDDEVEAHCLPMGVMFALLQAVADGQPGILSPVGLDTLVDPAVRGTGQNRRTRTSLTQRVQWEGRTYLWYRAPTIDAALLRGSLADEDGQVSLRWEPMTQAVFTMAVAARASGGPVLVQVKALARRRSLPAREVALPGVLVDALSVVPEQRQSAAGEYDGSVDGEWIPACAPAAPPLEAATVAARRVALLLRPGDLVNLGFGLPLRVAEVLAQEGLAERVTISLEHGPLGGLPAGSSLFGASRGPTAILRSADVFALYHAGCLDLAVLSAAEVDAQGDANVSRFGARMPGPGGYIDISGCCRRLVILCALRANGEQIEVGPEGLRCGPPAGVARWVRRVRERTFSAEQARRRGAEVWYVSDRCTLRLEEDGPVLTELAPGVDLERDVLKRMDFRPHLAPEIRRWPSALLAPGPFGLEGFWRRSE